MDAQKLSQTFVELADSLVADFDVFDLLHVLVERCVDLLDVSAAGLLLVDEQDRLRVAASSSDSARLLDLYQLQNDEGPCLECFHAGQPIAVHALRAEKARWPSFTTAAIGEGFATVLAIPLRWRGQLIGALNLFGNEHGTLEGPDIIPVAQAMADVCTIAILQERLGRQRDLLNAQLQHALDSRVAIEQAKGVLAATLDIDTAEAFELLRHRARNSSRLLSELAEEVVATRAAGDWEQHRHR